MLVLLLSVNIVELHSGLVRGFSEQNSHVTKPRTAISIRSLRHLMMISLNGPHWNNHDVLLKILITALKKWSDGKKYVFIL